MQTEYEDILLPSKSDSHCMVSHLYVPEIKSMSYLSLAKTIDQATMYRVLLPWYAYWLFDICPEIGDLIVVLCVLAMFYLVAQFFSKMVRNQIIDNHTIHL
jgi:hypothetical protein